MRNTHTLVALLLLACIFLASFNASAKPFNIGNVLKKASSKDESLKKKVFQYVLGLIEKKYMPLKRVDFESLEDDIDAEVKQKTPLQILEYLRKLLDISKDGEFIWKLLLLGNDRFMKRTALGYVAMDRLAKFKDHQEPVATVLSCSDSRVTPEYIFSRELGDLFNIKLAGNIIDTDALASIEYAVAKLNTPLVVILGHTKCGAVSAAVDHVVSGSVFPGHIQNLVTKIAPAVKSAMPEEDSTILINKSIVNNVVQSCENLLEKSEIVRDFWKSGKIAIKMGVVNFENGEVVPVNEPCGEQFKQSESEKKQEQKE